MVDGGENIELAHWKSVSGIIHMVRYYISFVQLAYEAVKKV